MSERSIHTPGAARPAVLVIDDDSSVRESVRLVLESDYDVLDAADGTTACQIVESYPIAAVVLDLLLPDVDGLEVLQELRAVAPSLPVVVLTAVKTVRTAVGAMKLGAFDYLTKPFDADELLAAVRRGIHGHAYGAPLTEQGSHVKTLRTGYGPRVVILGADAGRRTAIDVVISRFVATEPAESWTEILQRRNGAAPMCLIVDAETSLDSLTFLRTLTSRFAGCHVLLVQGSRPVPHEWLSLLESSLRPLTVDEVVNRVRILFSTRPGAGPEPPRMSAHTGRAIAWLASRYEADVTIERLAEIVHLPAHRFARMFLAETGLTLKAYMSRLRVQVARVLLATTDEKIETIARRVGFFDASHLSRTCVEQTGQRPSVYRRLGR